MPIGACGTISLRELLKFNKRMVGALPMFYIAEYTFISHMKF